MKRPILVFLLVACGHLSAQVVISEVYSDTPFMEYLYYYSDNYQPNPTPFIHHNGEFIELYNYTTEDIPLTGWSLADRVSRFNFPTGAVIKAHDFIVVAYKMTGQPDYFTTFFPTTAGKEDQIFYQDQIMLNNKRETVKLYMGNLRGEHFENLLVSEMSWQENDPIDNGYDPAPSTYYVPSYQLTPTVYTPNTANPLSADYVPPTQRLEDIPLAQNTLTDNAALMTWQSYAAALLTASCPENITIVEQSPNGTYLTSGQCFTYNGEDIVSQDCTPQPVVPQSTTQYSESELAEIAASIFLAPNPTNGYTTATFDGNITGKVTELQVTGINGTLILDDPIAPTAYTYTVNLTGAASQVYIFRFILNSGQAITKNLLKI